MATTTKRTTRDDVDAADQVMPVLSITVPKIELATIDMDIEGLSPLIVHAWSRKSKQAMLDKQMKKAKTGKAAKVPFQDFCESMYWLTPMPDRPTEADVAKARFGFPAGSFKDAAVDACRFADIKMTEARGAFHVDTQMAELEGPPPIMREDMVRVGRGTADVRFRGEFRDWRTRLRISYNTRAISPAQIANLLNIAGFGVGIGEWRPDKNGSFGRFRVA